MMNFLILILVPKLAYFLKTPALDPEPVQFFDQVMRQNIRERRASHQKKNDFIDSLAEGVEDFEKKGTKLASSEEELEDIIISNAIQLFFAGQDTTSSALSVASHFLAKHQDLQEKLYQEIKDAVDDNDDNLSLGKHHFPSLFLFVHLFVTEVIQCCVLTGSIQGRS